MENQKSISKEETKQQVTITKERQTEKATYKTTEKETTVTKDSAVITTIADNNGDNELSFDESEEKGMSGLFFIFNPLQLSCLLCVYQNVLSGHVKDGILGNRNA